MRVDNPINPVPAGRATGEWSPKPAPRVREVHAPEAVDAVVAEHRASSIQVSVANDPVTREIIVRMVDGGTGEVIQQIPAEEILRTARLIQEKIASERRPETPQGK